MSQQIPERFSGAAIDLSHLARSGAPHATPAQSAPGGPAPRQVTPGQAAPGQASPGQGASNTVVDVPSLVLDVTDQTFEQIAGLSTVVPIVFDLWAEWCGPCKTLSPIIEKVTRELAGRLVLAKVDVDANPGLAQAFNAQSIPTVVALIGGKPVPLFQGALPEQQVREFFQKLLELAAQNGVNGRVNAPESGDVAPEQNEPSVPPAHAAAIAALEQGDFAKAVTEYEQVLLKSPADHEAHAALVQTKLLARLQGKQADELRTAAAEKPEDIEAQLAVADLDISGGHVEDGFLRLLELFAGQTDDNARTSIRERLLELFEVVGASDPRVIQARTRLANLLY